MPFYFPTIACRVASEILGRQVNSGGDSLHFHEELSWLDGENAHAEFVHKYIEDAVELNRTLRADIVRQTWRSKARPTRRLDEYTLLFGNENGPRRIKRFFPEQQSYGILEDTTRVKDVDELMAQLTGLMKTDFAMSDDELYQTYKDQLEFKKLADPYFPTIVGGPGIGIPMDDTIWLEATVLEPELLADYQMYCAEAAVQHIRWLAMHGFKWLSGGTDLATSTGTVYSPVFFRNAVVPALKKINEACDKYGIIYCFKTDGNIWQISDFMFIDAGTKGYGEVDRDAGMTVGKLRERYPELIILGNNSSVTLHMGTEQQVRQETRSALEESGGLNYIAGPSNAVMDGTPVENIYAMIDEIERFKP